MKIDLKFFLLKRKIGIADFLSRFDKIEDALLYLDNNNFCNLPMNEIEDHYKSLKKKARPRGRKPRKRTTRSTKKSRDKKVETRETDSGYFETWKVPYVEPE